MAKLFFVLAVLGPTGLVGQDLREFNPRRVVPEFPPITEVKALKAKDVKDEVTDAELVLGVVVGGVARAYPINMLTQPTREIINDVLGGRAIAATW